MLLSRVEAALACSLILCPVAAATPPPSFGLSARGEFGSTYVHLDGGPGVVQGGEADNFWTVGGFGALDAAWQQWFHVQADVLGEANVTERSADDTYLDSYGGGLHLNLRDPELGSVGAFAGLGELVINNKPGNNPKTLSYVAGLEGQLFIDRLTLYLQGGYIDRESVEDGGDVDALADAGWGRLIGRFFPIDQVGLTTDVSYTQGRMDPDGDKVWIVGWRGEAEWRPHGWPISGFVKYTGAHYHQNDDNDDLNEHRIQFGLRFTFGQESLFANDRHGASLELPRWLQLTGETAGVLE